MPASNQSLTDFELLRLKLRVRDSREVAVLGTMATQHTGEFARYALDVVKIVDRINMFLADMLVADGSGIGGADFSGLSIGGLEAKRATLCINSKRACRLAKEGDPDGAAAVLQAAIYACFPPENPS
jgi:hypothetical protein